MQSAVYLFKNTAHNSVPYSHQCFLSTLILLNTRFHKNYENKSGECGNQAVSLSCKITRFGNIFLRTTNEVWL